MKWCRIILATLLATVPVALTSAVDVRAYVIAKTNGEIAANTTRVEECIADMNEVFAQIGLGFVLCQCSIVTSNELWVVDYTNAASRVSLCNYATNTGGLELYFVGEIASSQVRAFHTKRGIVIGPYASSRDVTHEIGHACGWKDIYETHSSTSLAVEGQAKMVWLPNDWSSYYPRGITQAEIIRRLLMYGRSGAGHIDIPAGDIHGLWYVYILDQNTRDWIRDWRVSLAPLGASRGMNRNPRSE